MDQPTESTRAQHPTGYDREDVFRIKTPRHAHAEDKVVASPGLLAQFKTLFLGTQHDPDSEVLRRFRQLQADLEDAVAERRTLEADHDALKTRHVDLKASHVVTKRALADATNKEGQASGHVQKLLQEAQQMKKYISHVRNQRGELETRCHESERAKQAEVVEVDKLREQLISFKRSATVLSRVSDQITDDKIRSTMESIFYASQGFAISALRGGKLDLDQLSQDAKDWLSWHALRSAKSSESCEYPLVMSLISQLLVEDFLPKHFFGLSTNHAIDAAMALSETITADNITEAKAWLEPTRKYLARLDEAALQESYEALVDAAVNQLRHSLADALSKSMDDNTLRKIFRMSLDLFRTLYGCKAVFNLWMPAVQPQTLTIFDPNIMTAVNSTEDDDALVGRSIEVSVFPGVYKFGDEFGENSDKMTVVSKAKVLLQEQPEPSHSRKK